MSGTSTATSARPAGSRLGWLTCSLEVAVAVAVVLLDLLLPTLVLLAMWGVSSAVRHEGPAAIGLRRPRHAWRMVAGVLAVSVVWSALVFGLVTPVVEQLAGGRRDVSQFAALEDDLPLLAAMLAASWTVAAVGEEVAYRGYLLTRVRALVPGTAGVAVAVVTSSVLFGLAHTEQGVVGVVLTALDGLMFSAVRLRYGTVWASVVAHGSLNTLGLTAYYLTGPVLSPW